eukprot:CAMPEP_0180821938 /NCGR_PEP_ID=MMETSP1038_2-20121128/71101_1 /TAXON_ID=632150 /ORGANISM="Azadinium spinosum, Strain 3D9" /LENGTH=225 /DNA_ID=CAMNT_0022864161 /DNA_START=97 /DNA_END=771 /DNA_ORIENTATION=+
MRKVHDAVIASVSDIKPTIRRCSEAAWVIQLRWATALAADSRHSTTPVRTEYEVLHPVIVAVEHIEGAARGTDNARGRAQLLRTAAHRPHSGNCTTLMRAWSEALDAVVPCVSHIQTAILGDRQSLWMVQLCRTPPWMPCPSHCTACQRAGSEVLHAVVASVGDVDTRSKRHRPWATQLRGTISFALASGYGATLAGTWQVKLDTVVSGVYHEDSAISSAHNASW